MNKFKAIIVCPHIAHENKPILVAFKTDRSFNEDSGWQLFCGEHQNELEEGAQVWSEHDAINKDQSLKELFSFSDNGKYLRLDEDSSWKHIS